MLTIHNIIQQQTMISAHIRKGNSFHIDSLEDALLQIIKLPENKELKPIRYSFYQFVCHLSDLCAEFLRSSHTDLTFNIFLLDHHMSKHSKDSEIYRHFMGLTQSWKRFLEVHEDAKLFLSLLTDARNSKKSVREFIKIRKTILKTLNQKILSQISVTHSDALTIGHILYENPQRNQVSKKINQLFISLKRKLINTAKIDGAVACEFFMNVAENSVIVHPLKEKKILHNFQQPNIKNYNVSFSEEFASCYRQDDEDLFKNEGAQKFGNVDQLEDEWERENNPTFSFLQAKMSLKQLFEKDRSMDEKLIESGIIKTKNYPEGWEEFLQTNRLMKEKLLNNKAF